MQYCGNGWPNREQTLLLQAALFTKDRAVNAWKEWVSQIDFDKIDPASYKLVPLLARNRDLDLIRDPLMGKCRGIYRKIWVDNQLIWKKLSPVLDQLRALGVGKIVLLKGMAMILHYYRDFGIRVIGDVDVLIAREDVPTAHDYLIGAGWEMNLPRFDPRDPAHLKRWHAVNYLHRDGMNLDLHWSMIHENSVELDRAVLKDAIAVDGLHIPNATDLLFLTCIHGVKTSPVPLIRWIADAVTILKNEQIDWDRLVAHAAMVRVCNPLFRALRYLRDEFKAPIPREVIASLIASPATRLETWELQANEQGRVYLAAWCRYCLNRGYLTLWSQIFHTPRFLQETARLKSLWQVPFYAVYWIGKRIFLRKKRLTA